MRPNDFPANPGTKLLEKLARKHDRAKAGAPAASVLVSFDDSATSSDLHTAERLLIEGEKQGAISLDRPKHTPHIIKRIRLVDPDKLAAYLGRQMAAHKADTILEKIAPLLSTAAGWIEDEVEGALGKWSRGERAFRIAADEHDKIDDLIRLLIAIDNGVDGRDIRTFSTAAGVDSKAFERHRGSIVQIAKRSFGWDHATPNEVLDRLGFRPFFQLVQFTGPIAIPSMSLDATYTRPSIGIPPDAAGAISLTGFVRSILTIENLASFNRHCREIDDPECLVLYTGGFPARPVLNFLHAATRQAPNAQIFHWGDIDVGGIRIFRNIEERLQRPIQPHLMDRSKAETYGIRAKRAKGLESIATSESGASDLALFLSGEDPFHLEQENVSPAKAP